MRCPDVVLSAMVSHPAYRETPGLLDKACEVFSKFPKWALARYLPEAAARRMLTACLPEIRRIQMRTGLWKRKYAEQRSCGILLALKHAGMLGCAVEDGLLRYDPFMPFAHDESLHGLLVRRQVMEQPLPTDGALQEKLLRGIREEQADDGGWAGTVAVTATRLELLLDLGADPAMACVQKGAAWILYQYKESVRGHAGGTTVAAEAPSMFTTMQYAEYRTIVAVLPEEDFCNACFCSLPLIQTGLAIRALIRLGYADDPRVDASCRSLLAISKPRQSDFSWCATGCRHLLERQVIEERKGKRIHLSNQ